MLSKSDAAENVAITEQREATVSLHYLNSFASQTPIFFFVNFTQKRRARFSTGGELHNLDKRLALTFPAPDCQGDRSLPSLMNSRAEKKWRTDM